MSGLFNEASLVLVPSGYKAGKVYSEVPTNGDGDLTFTRASSATRVNSDGLIEKVRTNLLTYSNTFSNAVWSVIGTPTLTANYDTNPLTGANDAWRFVAAGVGNRLVQSISGSNSAFSLYVKGTGQIVIRDNSGTYSFNATLTSSWQRIVVSIPAALTNIQFTGGSGGCDATIYAAQLEQGDIATDYIPTTTTAVSVGMTANVPRLDYSQGSCPALLLEPQRTNLLLRSEQFDNAYWVKNLGTITANATTAPDGTLTADLFTKTSAVNTVSQLGSPSSVYTTTGANTLSVYIKPNVGNSVLLRLDNNGNTANFLFNFTTKTFSNSGANVISSSFDELPNGWFRLKVTGNVTSTSWALSLLNLFFNPTSDSFYLWGAQLEAGAYATSYIPTTSATVTRLADACSKTGISSLIGQTEGTLYAEVNANITGINQNIELGDGTGSNRIDLRLNFANNYQLVIVQGGGVVVFNQVSAATFTQGQRIKLAAVYKSGDVTQLFVNGVSVLSATAGTITGSLNAIYSGAIGGSTDVINSPVSEIIVFPTALTDTQAIELTTL